MMIGKNSNLPKMREDFEMTNVGENFKLLKLGEDVKMPNVKEI